MSINEFIVITPDTCAMVADQLHPEVGGSASDSVDRIARYFDGMAIGSFYFNTISVELGMKQATTDITFSLIAATNTVTIGSTVFTGSNSATTTSQFMTNGTPSSAADIVAAASLVASINANAGTKYLVTASNVAGTAVIHLVVQEPGAIGNFVPVLVSANGSVSGAPGTADPYLLTASTYAALAQSAITNSGSTVLTGDLGISPAAGSFVTGFPPGLVSGTKHLTDAAAAQAHVDVTAAVVTLEGLVTASNTDITSQDLGGYTATPGNYKTRTAATDATWTAGALTLNGAGTYIFQFTRAMTLPVNASINLINGATADKVYFITATAITFGAANTLNGNFLAGSAITTAAGTVLHGRLLTYGVSGTAITFPSAAVVTNPSTSSGPNGGLDGSCLPKVILS